MARTLLGILQIIMKQEGAAETKTAITNAVRGIESATGRLAHGTWGDKFDAQLDRLKVSPTERAAILASYDRLNTALNGKMTGQAKAGWRNGVVAQLAAMRDGMETTEKRAVTMMGRLAATFSSVGRYALGGALVYGGYSVVRGGVNAAAEQQRVEAKGHFAGLSPEEQGQLKTASEELSAKYGLATSVMLEGLQEAALAMPTTADAIKSGDTIARLMTSLEAIYGSDGALSGTYSVLKAIDNIGQNQTPEAVLEAANAFMQAQQVLGADFSPDAFRQMLQYARTAGKALDTDFLYRWLPGLASETAGADAGTKLRANFDQLVVGRASDKAKAVQKKYGILGEDGGLIGRDVYEQNPVLWAHDVLLPALKKAGVDTENPVSLAQALGEITNNRQSSDFLAASLLSFEQYVRTATKRIPNASGLAAADEVRQLDPFAATQGFINSLSNLSGALGTHMFPVIIPALNGLSSSVEKMVTAVRGSSGAQLGLAGLAALIGGIGAWKVGSAAFGGITALTTAGPSLQTAAVMLQEAAVGLGGGATAAGTGKKPLGGGVDLMGTLSKALGLGFLADVAHNMGAFALPDGSKSWDRNVVDFLDPGLGRTLYGDHGTFFQSPGFTTPGPSVGMANNPMMTGIFPDGQSAPWGGDEAAKLAADTGARIKAAMDVTASPQVDTSSMQEALILANQLAAALRNIGGLAKTASAKVQRDVLSSYSDYGVAP